MDRQQRLFLVLKALSSSGRKALKINTLMKRAGYKKWEDLKKDLESLENQELIGYAKSGFPSDSYLHRRVVILRADIISVLPNEECEELGIDTESKPPVLSEVTVAEHESIELPSSVRIFTARFVELICAKHFEEATRILHKIKRRLPKMQWCKGYYYALNGVLLGSQSNDPRLFINSVSKSDYSKCIEEFKEKLKNPLSPFYDKGFFLGMMNYLKIRKATSTNGKRK